MESRMGKEQSLVDNVEYRSRRKCGLTPIKNVEASMTRMGKCGLTPITEKVRSDPN